MSFANTLRNLGPSRLAPIGLVMIGLVAFFVYMASRFTTPNLQLLYNDLDPKDSGAIVAKLEGMKIPVQIKGDGTQIFVPGDQVAKLRMLLAQDGLPRGGSMGYEIFDNTDGLSTSSFVQNINLVRALEGELARTISSLGPVKSARVHLVLPQREVFSRQKQEPSASIVLQMRTGRLEGSQVAAIQHLVAAAVPGLKPTQISIIDDKGALLARGGGDESFNSSISSTEEARVSLERRMSGEIESLLEKSIGPGKVRAEVTAEMDFDRITMNSEIYDPESRVVRSQQTEEESGTSEESGGGGTVSVANNIPEGQQSGAAGSNSNKNNRTSETINYEISKTIKQQVKESGQVKKLSVAVLVDGTYTKDDKGVETYAPRSEDNLKQLESLVKTAIGFDEERGDVVQVVNMQFVSPTISTEGASSDDAAGGIMGFSNSEIMKLVEMLVMGLVGILALLLVVRPMMMRALEPAGAMSGGGRMVRGSMPQLTGPSGGSEMGADMAELEVKNSELEDMINMKQIEGRIKASSLKRISEIVEKHPEETLSIIRTWLYQGKRDHND